MLAKRGLAAGAFIGAMGLAAFVATGAGEPAQAAQSKPNIIFFLLDDVGIDQLAVFGNGGLLPPKTPNMQLIADHGVKFTNVWALPECSPSRATLFTGRYPMRTGTDAVIVSGHLPQTYMAQFEMTLPRILDKAGYKSALIGKYHLGNDEDPAGNCAPASRGFATFQGSMTPGPTSVDTTAGGMAKEGSQVCGYFQKKTVGGACYTLHGDNIACSSITLANAAPGTDPARTCLQKGGIFAPNAACGQHAPKYSDFSRTNAYYVWPRTNTSGTLPPTYVNTDNACGSTIDRTYLTEAQGNDGVNWWKKQKGPRMLTLSFNTMHTPIQKPPTAMVPDPIDAPSTCNNVTPPRNVLNGMIESADVEIGRVLADLGFAKLAANGRTLVPNSLNLGNTMVVIIGDNGSQGAATRLPFNIQRSKGTVYQTGIWVPLIVAGPVVKVPNRSVDAMINIADLYGLFADIAGVDIKTAVPPSHVLDSQPMMPYLTQPAQAPIRVTNFSQLGVGTFNPSPSDRSWPCVIGNVCNDTLVDNQPLCENDNGGTWYGPGGKKQLNSCCAVQAYLHQTLTLAPIYQSTIRGGVFNNTLGAFKLVETQSIDCSTPITNASQKVFPWQDHQLATPVLEFYDLTLNPNMLDNPADNLAANCPDDPATPGCMPTQIDVNNYTRLNNQLQRLKSSANAQNNCRGKGDGNMDLRVTQLDVDNWKAFNGHGPSRYDINLDGQTDEKDLKIIQANLGHDCMSICDRADLNRDGVVNSTDLNLLNAQRGACADPNLCSGDLNGDGKVDATDVNLLKNASKTCK
ncbi:MAG: sulfatase-like hydrolase/transferase [Pseudolabrys sp.]